jgi:hypothetical protein
VSTIDTEKSVCFADFSVSRENQHTHFMFNNLFFENRTVYNAVIHVTTKHATDDSMTWLMHFA